MNNGSQQDVPPYVAQGAPKVNFNVGTQKMKTRHIILWILMICMISTSYGATNRPPLTEHQIIKLVTDYCATACLSNQVIDVTDDSFYIRGRARTDDGSFSESLEQHLEGTGWELGYPVVSYYDIRDYLLRIYKQRESQQSGPAYPPQGVGSADP